MKEELIYAIWLCQGQVLWDIHVEMSGRRENEHGSDTSGLVLKGSSGSTDLIVIIRAILCVHEQR